MDFRVAKIRRIARYLHAKKASEPYFYFLEWITNRYRVPSGRSLERQLIYRVLRAYHLGSESACNYLWLLKASLRSGYSGIVGGGPPDLSLRQQATSSSAGKRQESDEAPNDAVLNPQTPNPRCKKEETILTSLQPTMTST